MPILSRQKNTWVWQQKNGLKSTPSSSKFHCYSTKLWFPQCPALCDMHYCDTAVCWSWKMQVEQENGRVRHLMSNLVPFPPLAVPGAHDSHLPLLTLLRLTLHHRKQFYFTWYITEIQSFKCWCQFFQSASSQVKVLTIFWTTFYKGCLWYRLF